MKEIRIVIADDHPIFARGLKQVLESDEAIQVLAEVRDGEAALARIRELRPDAVVLDVNMPKKDGFDVFRAMLADRMTIPVIFLTMHDNEALFHSALDLGVQGYVLKDSALSEVVEAVKLVASGRNYASPSLATYLFRRRLKEQALIKQQPGLNDLTPTERRVLRLVASGKTTTESAAELFISVRTLEHHRASICGKLNLKGRDALLRFAMIHRSELL